MKSFELGLQLHSEAQSLIADVIGISWSVFAGILPPRGESSGYQVVTLDANIGKNGCKLIGRELPFLLT